MERPATAGSSPKRSAKEARTRGAPSGKAELTVKFETLYERFAQATFVFFLRKVGSASWAADLNQELYMRLSRSMRRFEGRCSWRTWIFTIARAVLADDLGRRYDHLAGRTVSLDTGEFADGLRLPASADREAVAVLLRERLRRCLRQLDQISRSVVLAHYFRGLTLRELTERLRLSNPSGSHAVLIGAQRKLRRCLESGRGV